MDISVFIAVCRELARELPGARMVELSETGEGELYFTLKRPGGRVVLLLCPRPELPRIYLYNGRPPRAKALTPSVQALWNRISGSTVTGLTQSGLERSVAFTLTRKSGSDEESATLVYEMAGKKPNLIVLDADGLVSVALSYVPVSDEALRPLLPGLRYEPPPIPGKLDPITATEEEFSQALSRKAGLAPDKALFAVVGGISPLLAREAVTLAGKGAEPEALRQALLGLLARVMDGPYEPRIINTPMDPVLAAFGLAQYEAAPYDLFNSMSDAAGEHYARLAAEKRITDTKRILAKDASRRLASAKRKLDALEQDMARSESADRYTLYANLLMAQSGSVPEGASEALLADLFAGDGSTVAVPLEPGLSAVKNAERYFRLARKAATGARLVKKRLDAAVLEVGRIEKEVAGIKSASSVETLDSLRPHTSPQGKMTKPSRAAGTRFPRFVSSDGFEVLYAKNAKSNDALTFKLAEPMDLWLHAQGFHGAHVIVRNPDRRPDIPLNTILEAASVAAWFSEARGEGSAAVDYTFKKYVRKPRDPASGQTVFTQNKTVFVRPARPGGEDE